MSTLARPARILAIFVLTTGTAWADSHHHGRGASAPAADAMGDDPHHMMHGMMRMMMQMHGPDTMAAGMGPMTGLGVPGMSGMSMMDRDMMWMMMGPDTMPGMPRGKAGQMMITRLGEYDADGDGTLSLDEFAAWHAAMMRETMVDRFQHLDANGDGAITSEEMNALADRVDRTRNDAMGRRPMIPGMPGQD